MTISNNSSRNGSMYLRMLKSIEAKGELFLSIYNIETRHYELLSFAMFMYDCSFYFNDMLKRWKEHLPHLGEARDVEFLEWKEKISKAINNSLIPVDNDGSVYTTGQEKNLCEEEIEGLYKIYKGNDEFKKKIEDMSHFLVEHNANIEQLVVDVGNIMTNLLGELDNSLLYADESKYEDVYRSLSLVWEPNWAAIKHDEYDIYVQKLTKRFFKKSLEKRIEELLSQFITNQFEPRWQPLINCSSDWDYIYDSENKTIDIQAIGRCAIAHRREEGFINKTLPTLLAFVRLITYMKEQVEKTETIQQKPIVIPDPLQDAIARTDFSKIENKVFVSYTKENKFDYKRLYVIIRDFFLPLVEQKYDWYALWRWCQQKGWLSDEKHTSFANQMNEWFPGRVVDGVAASLNDFDQSGNSYLHKTSPRDYNIDEAAKDAKCSRSKDYSIKGAKRVVILSEQLKDFLKDVQLKD